MTQPTPADDFETNDGDVNDNGNACDIDDSETLVPVPAKYYFNPLHVARLTYDATRGQSSCMACGLGASVASDES